MDDSKLNKLTIQDIRNAPTKWLKQCLKHDLELEIIDMISKELYEVREAGQGEVI